MRLMRARPTRREEATDPPGTTSLSTTPTTSGTQSPETASRPTTSSFFLRGADPPPPSSPSSSSPQTTAAVTKSTTTHPYDESLSSPNDDQPSRITTSRTKKPISSPRTASKYRRQQRSTNNTAPWQQDLALVQRAGTNPSQTSTNSIRSNDRRRAWKRLMKQQQPWQQSLTMIEEDHSESSHASLLAVVDYHDSSKSSSTNEEEGLVETPSAVKRSETALNVHAEETAEDLQEDFEENPIAEVVSGQKQEIDPLENEQDRDYSCYEQDYDDDKSVSTVASTSSACSTTTLNRSLQTERALKLELVVRLKRHFTGDEYCVIAFGRRDMLNGTTAAPVKSSANPVEERKSRMMTELNARLQHWYTGHFEVVEGQGMVGRRQRDVKSKPGNDAATKHSNVLAEFFQKQVPQQTYEDHAEKKTAEEAKDAGDLSALVYKKPEEIRKTKEMLTAFLTGSNPNCPQPEQTGVRDHERSAVVDNKDCPRREIEDGYDNEIVEAAPNVQEESYDTTDNASNDDTSQWDEYTVEEEISLSDEDRAVVMEERTKALEAILQAKNDLALRGMPTNVVDDDEWTECTEYEEQTVVSGDGAGVVQRPMDDDEWTEYTCEETVIEPSPVAYASAQNAQATEALEGETETPTRDKDEWSEYTMEETVIEEKSVATTRSQMIAALRASCPGIPRAGSSSTRSTTATSSNDTPAADAGSVHCGSIDDDDDEYTEYTIEVTVADSVPPPADSIVQSPKASLIPPLIPSPQHAELLANSSNQNSGDGLPKGTPDNSCVKNLVIDFGSSPDVTRTLTTTSSRSESSDDCSFHSCEQTDDLLNAVDKHAVRLFTTSSLGEEYLDEEGNPDDTLETRSSSPIENEEIITPGHETLEDEAGEDEEYEEITIHSSQPSQSDQGRYFELTLDHEDDSSVAYSVLTEAQETIEPRLFAQNAAGTPGSSVSSAARSASDLLRRDVWSTDISIVLNALEKLAHESGRDRNHRTNIVRMGGILAVVRVLDMNFASAEAQALGCWILGNLALDEDSQVSIIQVGGVDAVLNAMRAYVEDWEVQEAGCFALFQLTQNKVDELVIEASAIETILSSMLVHSDHPEIQEDGFRTLATLCLEDEEMMTALSDAGGIAAMSEAMQRPWRSADSKSEAAYTFSQLCAKSSSMAF